MVAPTREHFRRTLGWVAMVHLFFLLLLGVWSVSRPKPPKPIEFINMLPPGNLVHGRPGPSEGPVVGKQFQPAAPAPPAQSKPSPPSQPEKAVEPPPKPEPVKPPEPTPEPEPEPVNKAPDPNSWSTEKPKKTPKPEKTPPAKAEKPKPKIKIDLSQEVERPSSRAAAHSTASNAKSKTSDVDGTDPGGTGKAREGVRGMTAQGVAERLGRELHASGVDKAVGVGLSGSANGNGTGENSWYYTLIRDQMYQSWDMPMTLAGKRLQTLIRIFVEKSGTISKVELVRSSGNKEHDDSALAAVRRVGRIREPLPEGMDGSIDINFRLTE